MPIAIAGNGSQSPSRIGPPVRATRPRPPFIFQALPSHEPAPGVYLHKRKSSGRSGWVVAVGNSPGGERSDAIGWLSLSAASFPILPYGLSSLSNFRKRIVRQRQVTLCGRVAHCFRARSKERDEPPTGNGSGRYPRLQ